jgi:sialidase-1
MLIRHPALMGLAAAALAAAAPAPGAEVLGHIVVHKDDTNYEAWPNIERLANGDLLCSFYQAVRRDGITHLDTTGRALCVRSSDEGRTWTAEPSVIYDDEDSQENIAVRQLSDGRLMANFYSWRNLTDEQKQAVTEPQYWVGQSIAPYKWAYVVATAVVTSANGGRTWDEHYTVIRHPAWLWLATNKPVLELPGGTLLIPMYGWRHGDSRDTSVVMRSEDGGLTWTHPAVVADGMKHPIGFNETSLVWLPNDTILAMARTAGGDDHLYQSRSSNRGLTWSEPVKTPMVGHPPDLLLLRNGDLLCTYGYRHAPYGVRACISRDFGRTWDMQREVVLRDDGLGGDLGYPASVELKDGTILTVYYFYGQDGVRHIAGTFWRP